MPDFLISSVPIARREAVARIIDPWSFFDEPTDDEHGKAQRKAARGEAFAKADAILALEASDADRVPRIATVADYNDAFDPADEAFGGAFRDGFREGWIFAQSPDGEDYDELAEQYGRAVDIEPSEAWDGHRDKYFAMLPLAAFPEIGKPLTAAYPKPEPVETQP